MTYTFHSFFAGAYDGFAVAMKAAGFEMRCAVESDEWRQEQLKKHHPEARVKGDIHNVGRHNLEPVDVVCGGFPCQDISYAGAGTGIRNGSRSGLWYEFARVICELRPRAIILENTTAITTAGRGLDVVLGQLSEMGYDAIWLSVRASDFGAPHQRERWFLVGYANQERQLQQEASPRIPNYTNPKWHNPSKKQRRNTVIRSPLTTSLVVYASKERFQARQQAGIKQNQTQVGARMVTKLKRYGTPPFPSGTTQSRLGGAVDGLPGGIHQLLSHRFPAPPGGAQHEWEPPRVVNTSEVQDRKQTLEALGDAIVPQQVVGICWGVHRFLQHIDLKASVSHA